MILDRIDPSLVILNAATGDKYRKIDDQLFDRFHTGGFEVCRGNWFYYSSWRMGSTLFLSIYKRSEFEVREALSSLS